MTDAKGVGWGWGMEFHSRYGEDRLPGTSGERGWGLCMGH